MKIKIYTTTLLRRITLPVLMIVTGLGVHAFFSEAVASELQTDSLTHMNVLQYHRCQGQWRHRCGNTDTATENTTETGTVANNLSIRLDNEAKFRRCGRLWQYHCASDKNTLESKVSIARREYLINDQQTFDEQNDISAEQYYTDKELQYRRCGRLWQRRCGDRR